ncbi:MAG: M20/M25/M40 family metallo-hydrolase, partial [Verrucomicrobia bacterium]|nr:M20/M25/M40 family metallo-hydrolase [Verrucomicrobiota bacterium]
LDLVGLGSGLVTVTITANENTKIDHLKTNLQKMVLKNKIYPADFQNVELFTNSVDVNFRPWIASGLQTIKVNGQDLVLNKVMKLFNWRDTANKNIFIPKGNIEVIGDGYFALNEESYFNPDANVEKLKYYSDIASFDYIIVGEASEGRLNIAQRGRAEILIHIFGRGAHASVGRTTVNPLEQVAFIIEAFHVWYRSEAVALLGKRNIVPTDIKIPLGGGGGIDGRGGNSTVPNEVDLTYDVRTLPGDTQDSIIQLVRGNMEPVLYHGKKLYPESTDPTIEYASDECTTFTGVHLKQSKFAPAWKTEEDEEIVVRAKKGLTVVGLPVEIGAYSFCTDGSGVVKYRELSPEANCQIIGFGPSQESLAHTTNEYISLDEMQKAFKGYAGIVSELLRLS